MDLRLSKLSKLFNRSPKKQSVENSSLISSSGAGGANDFTINQRPSFRRPASVQQMAIETEVLYYTDWQSRKIIDVPAHDTMREGFTFAETPQEVSSAIQGNLAALNFHQLYLQSIRLERLHGGNIIVMGIDDGGEWEDPVRFDQLSATPIKFLNVVPRTRLTRQGVNYDPLSPDFGHSDAYTIGSHNVHRSRLLVLDGDPILPSQESSAISALANFDLAGFGYPILLTLWEDLLNATSCRQAVSQLVQKASSYVYTGDLDAAAAYHQGSNQIDSLKQHLNNISIYNSTLLPAGSSLESVAVNFGALPEVEMNKLKILAAGSGIPISKFLGESASGLQSTGHSDLENYYVMIAGYQTNKMRPNLEKLIKILLVGASGDQQIEIPTIEFKPLWSLSDAEETQIKGSHIEHILSMVDRGVLSTKDALNILKEEDLLSEETESSPPPPQDFGGFNNGQDDDQIFGKGKAVQDTVGTSDTLSKELQP